MIEESDLYVKLSYSHETQKHIRTLYLISRIFSFYQRPMRGTFVPVFSLAAINRVLRGRVAESAPESESRKRLLL